MSWGGSVQGMKDSLNNNKKLRINHKAFDKQKGQVSYGTLEPLTLRKASSQELEVIAEKLKQVEKREQIGNIIGGVLFLVIAALIVYYSYPF